MIVKKKKQNIQIIPYDPNVANGQTTQKPDAQNTSNHSKAGYTSMHRFGWIILSLALVVIIFVLFLFYNYEKTSGKKQLLQDGTALCSLITDAARQTFFLEDNKKNVNLLDYVVREKGLVYCMILDNKRLPLLELGRYIPEQNSQIAQNSWDSDYLLTQKYKNDQNGDIIYEFSKPIFLQGNKAGVAKIGLSLSHYVYFNKNLNYLMGTIALAILGLVLIFYFLLRKMFMPLYKINEDLGEMITENRESPKIEISLHGETGQIAERINNILQLQQNKNMELEKANTDLEVANKVLYYEKCRTRGILDNLKTGVVFIDSMGKAILSNQKAGHLLKVEENAYLNRSWQEFLEEQSQELGKLFREFRQKENIYGHDFLEHKSQNGDISLMLCHDCFYLLDEEDKPLGFLWIITDITSQKQAESSRHEFVNNVAHELKTPLNTLRSYTEMILDGEVEDEETKKEFFNSINEEAIRLSRLINNLLNISKMETGHLKLTQTLIKMDKLIKDCYQTVLPQAKKKDIQFICDVPDKMPNSKLDKDLIEVAILNLLTNAIKYTPEAGKVVLKGVLEEDKIFIKVTDSGCGIEQSEVNRVFDKFFRASNEEVKKESGTGLGLSLARNIVQMHKGDIQVESKLGMGSSFTIILPREEVFIK